MAPRQPTSDDFEIYPQNISLHFSGLLADSSDYRNLQNTINANEPMHLTPTSRHFACRAGGVPAVRGR